MKSSKPEEQGSVDAWDLEKGERTFTFHAGEPLEGPFFVDFTPDGKSAIASGRVPATWPIARWDLVSGETKFASESILYPEGVDVSHDGKLAVIDGAGTNVALLELPALKVLRHVSSDTHFSGRLQFSSDDASLVDVSDMQAYEVEVHLLAPRTMKVKKRWSVYAARLSPDRTRVAMLGKAFSGVVDASSGKELRKFESPPGVDADTNPYGAIEYSADGSRLSVFDFAGKSLGSWEVATGKKVTEPAPVRIEELLGTGSKRIQIEERRATEVDAANGKSTGRSWALPKDGEEATLSPDGRFLAIARKSKTVRVLRLADGVTIDLGVVWIGDARRGFAVGADGSFEGPNEAAACGAQAVGRTTQTSAGHTQRFFR